MAFIWHQIKHYSFLQEHNIWMLSVPTTKTKIFILRTYLYFSLFTVSCHTFLHYTFSCYTLLHKWAQKQFPRWPQITCRRGRPTSFRLQFYAVHNFLLAHCARKHLIMVCSQIIAEPCASAFAFRAFVSYSRLLMPCAEGIASGHLVCSSHGDAWLRLIWRLLRFRR